MTGTSTPPGPGRSWLMAVAGEFRSVVLLPGNVVLERGGGGVAAELAGHEGGEPAYPGGRRRDPGPGDGDEPAGGIDRAGAVVRAVGHHGGDLEGHGEHVGVQPIIGQVGVEGDQGAAGDDGGDVAADTRVAARVVADPD